MKSILGRGAGREFERKFASLSFGAMQGPHLTADLRHCAPEKSALTGLHALRQLCQDAVAASGLRAVGELFYPFPAPGGVTGVVLLAESHLAAHPWPELGAVTLGVLDVYGCNLHGDHSSKAEALMTQLQVAFGAARVELQRVIRGVGL